MSETKTVAVTERVLSKNDLQAQENRKLLHERKIFSVNLISSPGAGKTYLLEETLNRVASKISCAVITGDQRTDQDAKRLANRGAPVAQIETKNTCHLDASHIAGSLGEVLRADTRILFIENVGNLICPAAFDLGEDMKITLLSTTEGEDKPIKYPSIFSKTKLVLITKIDLVPHLRWNRQACHEYISQVAPGAAVMELSAMTGEGMEQWIEFLMQRVGVRS